MNIDIILKYFPEMSDDQLEKAGKLHGLYLDWNEKINVISRTDIENLYLHHVLHSLSILKFYGFREGSEILDLGTGGGFPGIPLAIMLPECRFTLIDGTAKKIKVVNDIAEKLGLENVTALHLRAEECRSKHDFVVTRAVADLGKLMLWSRPLLKEISRGPMPSGLFALKGGDIRSEIKLLKRGSYYELSNISDKIGEDYFSEKYIIYAQK
jgi:16S rRNA (guanine527-N7)-methyltransferase